MTHLLQTAMKARSALLDVNLDDVIPAPLAAPKAWLEVSPEHMMRATAGIHTPFTIILDGPERGRMFGDVAPKNQCILDGRPGCWTAPDEAADDLSRSMNGYHETAEGEMVVCGVIPMDCNHAPDGTDKEAIDFMAHTGVQLAIVRYVHTPTTIAAVGVVSPGLTYGQAVRARAAAQSGDWRALLHEIRFDDGRPPEFRFTGSVCVNVGGLPLQVRMAALNPAVPQYGHAIVIQETTMTTSSPRTAGATYRVEPKPPIDRNDQVTFGGRTGRVTGLTVDTMGNVLVAVAEVFPNGEMLTEEADGVEAIVVPISQVTPTGLRYEIEGWDDSGSRSDVVVAGATSAACSCNERRAAIDKGAAPADVTVADPTNDILLERLDAAERTIAALNERIDTMEAAVAMSHEAAQVAASLGITS